MNPEVNIGEGGEGAGMGGKRRKWGRSEEIEGGRRRRRGKGKEGSHSSSPGRVRPQEKALCSALCCDMGWSEQVGQDWGHMCCRSMRCPDWCARSFPQPLLDEPTRNGPGPGDHDPLLHCNREII